MDECVFDFCKADTLTCVQEKRPGVGRAEERISRAPPRGYGRLRGHDATQTVASLYEVSRLYNFFQPSFKLKSKTRHGARVTKRYEAPLTPLERVLRSASVPEATKRRLRARFRALDPLDLLRRMREAQQHVAQRSECGTAPTETKTPGRVSLADFLASLGTTWQDGAVRPTHHRKARVAHT